MTVSGLGDFLKRVRVGKDRSIRWVERQSKASHPGEKERQISHTYLRQIEEGVQAKPNPAKLRTLAEIYGVDYSVLMAKAGYLEPETGTGHETAREAGQHSDQAKLVLAREMFARLESQGIRPEYFMRGVIGLAQESLQIIHRLITTMAIQGKGRRTRESQSKGERRIARAIKLGDE